MKIDIYTHILPKKYFAALGKRVNLDDYNLTKCQAVGKKDVRDIDIRLNVMNRYPEVLQVLSVSLPPLDKIVTPINALDLCKIANDEMAELVLKHPDKFIAGVACLPVDDMDLALKEMERAITQLGLKGVQLFARVNGEGLDNPKFKPLYEKMAEYDLPIWIHPA
jgi:predicted TIM-barrel fold metal-dependent hydrolase